MIAGIFRAILLSLVVITKGGSTVDIGSTGAPVGSCINGSIYVQSDAANAPNAIWVCVSTTWTQTSSQISYHQYNNVQFSNVALTNASYVTVATPSVTLGTSYGPTGAWLVQVNFYFSITGTLANAYPCITGTNAGTNGAGSFDANDGAACNSSPINQLAGSFNSQRQSSAYWVAQYPNGATVSFPCQVRATTTVNTAYGYCTILANPI